MNRIININGEIKDKHGIEIANKIMAANMSPNVDNIILFINSNGGDVDVITIIWETIKMCDKPVVSLGTYLVASTAAAIFMMANRRIILPNTKFVLHKSVFTLNGEFTVDELKDMIESSERNTELLLEPVIQNSKISKQVLYRNIKGTDWEIYDEFCKYGIATEEYDINAVKFLLSNTSRKN